MCSTGVGVGVGGRPQRRTSTCTFHLSSSSFFLKQSFGQANACLPLCPLLGWKVKSGHVTHAWLLVIFCSNVRLAVCRRCWSLGHSCVSSISSTLKVLWCQFRAKWAVLRWIISVLEMLILVSGSQTWQAYSRIVPVALYAFPLVSHELIFRFHVKNPSILFALARLLLCLSHLMLLWMIGGGDCLYYLRSSLKPTLHYLNYQF